MEHFFLPAQVGHCFGFVARPVLNEPVPPHVIHTPVLLHALQDMVLPFWFIRRWRGGMPSAPVPLIVTGIILWRVSVLAATTRLPVGRPADGGGLRRIE